MRNPGRYAVRVLGGDSVLVDTLVQRKATQVTAETKIAQTNGAVFLLDYVHSDSCTDPK